MDREHKEQLEKQLKHFKQRKESLLIWMDAHDYSHPDFSQNMSDLRIAGNKIEAIANRLQRQGSKSNVGIATMTAPKMVNVKY